MKIALLTIADPLNKRTWSGINYKIYEQLLRKNKNDEIYLIGPLKTLYLNKALFLLDRVLSILFKKNYNAGHSVLMSMLYSFQVNWKLKHKFKNTDVIVSVVASPALSFINTKVPIIYFTDATFHSMIDYYIFNLLGFSKAESDCIERRALKNTNRCVFPSEWALNETVKNYSINEFEAQVLKMGPNFSLLPSDEIKRIVGKDKPFNILFVGVDWSRKGGDFLLKAFMSLISKGFKNIHLTICGTIPPNCDQEYVSIYPFLDKNKDSDSKILQDLYKDSHLFVLPTRAECAGIVFAEAAAYSLPILSTNTGGVCSYVEDQYNGFTLNLNDDYPEYEKLILLLMTDQELYSTMSANSFRKYKNELNWDKFGDGLSDILNDLFTDRKSIHN